MKKYIIVIIIVLISLFYFTQNNTISSSVKNDKLINNTIASSVKNDKLINNTISSSVKNDETEIVNKLNEKIEIINKINDEIADVVSKKIYLDMRDRKVLYDDFAPPERRLPEYQYPNQKVREVINIPTRGLPENYHILGLVIQDETSSVYNIFGRQTYPSSNQYEYYVQIDDFIKIPIYNKGNRELMEGDHVNVESKGNFRVKLYNFDTPRYNPYIIN